MSRTTKIVATIAVVGAVAAVAALLGMKDSASSLGSGHSRLLQSTDTGVDADTTREFQKFINLHNKNYITKEEYGARLAIFQSNLKFVKNHDSVAEGFSVAINKFSDLSHREFEAMNGLKAVPKGTFLDGNDDDQSEPHETTLATSLGAPVSIDWRQSGAVTSIKN